MLAILLPGSFSDKSRFDLAIHLQINSSRTRLAFAYRIKSKFLSLASKVFIIYLRIFFWTTTAVVVKICLPVCIAHEHTPSYTEHFSLEIRVSVVASPRNAFSILFIIKILIL